MKREGNWGLPCQVFLKVNSDDAHVTVPGTLMPSRIQSPEDKRPKGTWPHIGWPSWSTALVGDPSGWKTPPRSRRPVYVSSGLRQSLLSAPGFVKSSLQKKKWAQNGPVTSPWTKDQTSPFPTAAPSHSRLKTANSKGEGRHYVCTLPAVGSQPENKQRG